MKPLPLEAVGIVGVCQETRLDQRRSVLEGVICPNGIDRRQQPDCGQGKNRFRFSIEEQALPHCRLLFLAGWLMMLESVDWHPGQ